MNKSKLLATLGVVTLLFAVTPASAETLGDLAKRTHYHGVSFARSGSAELLLATHHGIFAVDKTGDAEQVSVVHDYMGFSADPSNPLTYFASGHPASGGNSGFLRSIDGGATWTMISEGTNGPVDFHAMTVSPADPKTIYGSFKGIQTSHDSGQSWSMAGSAPQKLVSIAASAVDANKLYAATLDGLKMSVDGGANWQSAAYPGEQISLVETAPNGGLVAFVLGKGLMTADETKLEEWTLLSNGFGNAIPLHLAFDSKDSKHVVLTTQDNAVLESHDGGATFAPFGK